MKLPVRGHRFLTDEEMDKFDINRDVGEDKTHGYFLEVDLSFPPAVQDLTYDLCLAPERQDVCYDDLSPYGKELHDKCYPHLKGRHKSTKLMATMKPRKRYVVHGQNLAFYLSLGVQLDKVHRILTFEQDDFLAKFIHKVTELRSQAQSSILKLVYKLFANSNFGKFIESPTRYLSARFIFNDKQYLRAVREPYFQGVRQVNDVMSVAIFKPESICFDKATPVGVSILELSKLICYKLFYEVLLKKFGRDKMELIFSDTGKKKKMDTLNLKYYQLPISDSFMLALQTPNLVKDIEDLIEHFDTSNYPSKSRVVQSAHLLPKFFFQPIIDCTARRGPTISSW